MQIPPRSGIPVLSIASKSRVAAARLIHRTIIRTAKRRPGSAVSSIQEEYFLLTVYVYREIIE